MLKPTALPELTAATWDADPPDQLELALPAELCHCDQPIGDFADWPHCFRCGHDFDGVLA